MNIAAVALAHDRKKERHISLNGPQNCCFRFRAQYFAHIKTITGAFKNRAESTFVDYIQNLGNEFHRCCNGLYCSVSWKMLATIITKLIFKIRFLSNGILHERQKICYLQFTLSAESGGFYK